ncbi:MAG: hypothetical protein AB8B55_02525, partial [Mariniblastus sp.]
MSQVKCPTCGRHIRLTEKLYGRKFKCKCRTVVRLPESPIIASVVPTVPVVRLPDAPRKIKEAIVLPPEPEQIPTLEPLSDSDVAIPSPFPPQPARDSAARIKPSPAVPPTVGGPSIDERHVEELPIEIPDDDDFPDRESPAEDLVEVFPVDAPPTPPTRFRQPELDDEIPAAIPVLTPVSDAAPDNYSPSASTAIPSPFNQADVSAVPVSDGDSPNPLMSPNAAIPPSTSLPPIRFKCPKCMENLEVAGESAGQISRCPCGTKIRVPLESSLPRTVSRDPLKKNIPRGINAPLVPTPLDTQAPDPLQPVGSIANVAPKYKAPKKKKLKKK